MRRLRHSRVKLRCFRISTRLKLTPCSAYHQTLLLWRVEATLMDHCLGDPMFTLSADEISPGYSIAYSPDILTAPVPEPSPNALFIFDIAGLALTAWRAHCRNV